MSLQSWQENSWLYEHQTSPQEIANLLAVADRDLADCRTPGLSADWRLNIAYNAALQAATAGLYASGYRAAREMHPLSHHPEPGLHRRRRFCSDWPVGPVSQEAQYRRVRARRACFRPGS